LAAMERSDYRSKSLPFLVESLILTVVPDWTIEDPFIELGLILRIHRLTVCDAVRHLPQRCVLTLTWYSLFLQFGLWGCCGKLLANNVDAERNWKILQNPSPFKLFIK
jgi:hypothetical protein